MIFGHSLAFWMAVGGAIVVRLLTSDNHSLPRISASVASALFAAWAFTGPVLKYLELAPDDYEVLIAALLALTGEGLIRSLISLTSSPEKLVEFWHQIRGKKMSGRLKVSPILWASMIAFGWTYVTGIEGRLLPAAAPMQLIGSFPTKAKYPQEFQWEDISGDGPFTAIWIESARLRPSCNFHSFDWRLGHRGGKNVPVSIRPGEPIVRDDGKFVAGPWIVWIKEWKFHGTYADVLHRCTFIGIDLPWLVRSRFWN